MAEISGIAHIQLCVRDMNASRPFYAGLLGAMGMRPVIDDDSFYYCVGGKTAVAITPASGPHKNSTFTQGAVGLHHVCFRAKSRDDVEALYKVACELGANIIRKPEESNYAPGYYSTLFEDPDGIRIEVNYVPGKGLLNESASPGHQ
jgi:catechol 2,3-dioxygenase-like lactoylglutathione lyase family enzyme